MGIGLTQPLGLLLLALALTAMAWGWSGMRSSGLSAKRNRLAAGTRLVLFLILGLAVAGLEVERTPTAQTIVVVADRTASMQRSLGDQTAAIARIRDGLGSDDLLGVIASGRDAFVEVPPRSHPVLGDFTTAVNPNYTDLESGLRLAGSIMPADRRAHVVLISDGRQNICDAVAQARLLHQQGARVDVLPAAVAAGSEVRIDGLRLPSAVPPGSRAHAVAEVSSTIATTATLRTELDGVPVDTRSLIVPAGDSSVDVVLPPASPGFHRARSVIDPVLDTFAQNNVGEALMLVLGTQRVAIVEGHPGAAANLRSALQSAGGIAVDVLSPSQLPAAADGLAAYQSIALVDVAAGDLGDQRMAAIQTAVRDLGLGLTTLGGAETYGPGGFAGTTLERSLPISMNISDRADKPPIAVVLVLESVESGAGDAVVRGAARSVVAHLSPRDYVGVTDSVSGLVVPLTRVGDGKALESAIDAVSQFGDPPSYGPYIAKARDALSAHPEATKHVIVLGDGDNPPTSTALIDSLVKAGITVSAVGVDIDHSASQMATMQAIAVRGNGRFYRSGSVSQVPSILLDETDHRLKPWIVQQSFEPTLLAASPTLAGLDLGQFPGLDGYVAATAKPGATVVLASPQRDPILAEWQYGLGRVVSWTSDSEGRWSAPLLAWAQAGKLLANLVTAALPLRTDPDVAVTTSTQGDHGHLAVDIAGPTASAASLSATASVVGPDQGTLDVSLSATAPGHFEADFPADQVGSYLLHVVVSSGGRAVHAITAGLAVAYSPEFRFLGVDRGTLQAIAEAGGGTVLTGPEQAVAVAVPPVRLPVSLVTPLLILAALLLPIDVAVRRLVLRPGDAAAWREAVPGRRSRAPVEAPATLQRLRVRRDERRLAVSELARPPGSSPAAAPSPPDPRPVTPAAATKPRPPDAPGQAATPVEEAGDLAARLLAARRRGRRD